MLTTHSVSSANGNVLQSFGTAGNYLKGIKETFIAEQGICHHA